MAKQKDSKTLPMSLGSKEFAALFSATNIEKPSQRDVEALRQALVNSPDLWRYGGDMVCHAEDSLLGAMTKSVFVEESARRGLAELRASLASENDDPLVKLLIDQVAICWLVFYDTQYQYSEVFVEPTSPDLGDYWQRRLNMAQKRYLRAVEALARVRRLVRPATFQVNIGAQQVNVAGNVNAVDRDSGNKSDY